MSFVIKASREADLYVLWNSTTCTPLFAGDRARLATRLIRGTGCAEGDPHTTRVVEERLARVDTTGTSVIQRVNSTTPPDGAWESPGLMCGVGFLPRHRFEEFFTAYHIMGWVNSLNAILDPIF